MSAAERESRDPHPGTWTVKVTAPPPIVCPPWCTVSTEQHLSELSEWEGQCLHAADRPDHGWGLTLTTCSDGSASPEGDGVRLVGPLGEEVTADEAEEIVQTVLELVKVARA